MTDVGVVYVFFVISAVSLCGVDVLCKLTAFSCYPQLLVAEESTALLSDFFLYPLI